MKPNRNKENNLRELFLLSPEPTEDMIRESVAFLAINGYGCNPERLNEDQMQRLRQMAYGSLKAAFAVRPR